MKVTQENAIKIWPWNIAPQEYKNLSSHGGDEDWVAFIPQEIFDNYLLSWMDEGTAFGCFCVSEHKVIGGIVKIGAHS